MDLQEFIKKTYGNLYYRNKNLINSYGWIGTKYIKPEEYGGEVEFSVQYPWMWRPTVIRDFIQNL